MVSYLKETFCYGKIQAIILAVGMGQGMFYKGELGKSWGNS